MQIIKSLLFTFFFIIFLQMITYIFRVVYMVIFKKNTNIKNDDQNTIKMTQCETCKTYILKSEAYMNNGKIYCKKEHAEKKDNIND